MREKKKGTTKQVIAAGWLVIDCTDSIIQTSINFFNYKSTLNFFFLSVGLFKTGEINL